VSETFWIEYTDPTTALPVKEQPPVHFEIVKIAIVITVIAVEYRLHAVSQARSYFGQVMG
jgi:hypothetical protein